MHQRLSASARAKGTQALRIRRQERGGGLPPCSPKTAPARYQRRNQPHEKSRFDVFCCTTTDIPANSARPVCAVPETAGRKWAQPITLTSTFHWFYKCFRLEAHTRRVRVAIKLVATGILRYIWDELLLECHSTSPKSTATKRPHKIVTRGDK